MRTVVYTSAGGGGGVLPSDVDILWSESVGVGDSFAPRLSKSDTMEMADAMGRAAAVIREDLGVSDQVAEAILAARLAQGFDVADAFRGVMRYPDSVSLSEGPLDATLHIPDGLALADGGFQARVLHMADSMGMGDSAFRVLLTDLIVNPSGTPNNDPAGDATLSQASPSTNFGASFDIGVIAPTLGTNESRGCFKFDFRKLAGFAARSGGTQRFTWRGDWGGVVGTVTITLNFYDNAGTNPFTESTVTWNAPPTLGTLIHTAAEVLGTAAVTVNTAIPDADVTDLIGAWALIMMTSSDLVSSTSVISRETVGPASPRWTVDLVKT